MENLPRWDLTQLYGGLDDPKIGADLEKAEELCGHLARLKGRLAKELPAALELVVGISELSGALEAYFYLLSSCDVENQGIKKAMSAASERLARAFAATSFIDIEIAAIPEADYAALQSSPIVARHKPYLDRIRRDAKFQLSEKEESLLVRISPFASGEWDDMLDEFESKVPFVLDGKTLTLAEIVHAMNASHDSDTRSNAMKALNDTLGRSNYSWLRARALNLVAGRKSALDSLRGFESPMHSRNLHNNLDDKVVDALHESVRKYAVPEMARYHKILAKLLGKEKLLWSDRNAPLPFEDKRTIPYPEAEKLVLDSFKGFSPKIAALLRESLDARRLDAPALKGKASGAYNCTIVGEGGATTTWTFLNYLGTQRDVMTLAHELGHAAHGLLAGARQGVLLASAPMAYAETASIFGEMLVFENLLGRAAAREEKLCLLCGKITDWINSVGRQISFSFFEQRLHARRKEGKLSAADLDKMWLDVSREFYGELFDYSDMERLWSYVGHFMRPFYVYAYAFGELFTQSLFAARPVLGKRFEPLYMEMLSSGGAKDAVELMAPFGLDPRDPGFWRRGIEASVGRWLSEVEKLV